MNDFQFNNRITVLEGQVKGILGLLDTLTKELGLRIKVADLKRTEDTLSNLIKTCSDQISIVEQKFNLIKLPSESRFYLDGADVDSFKTNFSKLKAMMTKFESLYNKMVAYAAKLGS